MTENINIEDYKCTYIKAKAGVCVFDNIMSDLCFQPLKCMYAEKIEVE